MPPHRRELGADGSSRGAGSRTRREGNAVVRVRALSSNLHHDLETILLQREALEQRLAAVDEEVYDLESEYLKACVELGGSLFDGYGVERSSLLDAGPACFLASPTAGSPSGRGAGSNPTGYATLLGSPSASSDTMGVFGAAVNSSGGHGTAMETSTMAFRARTLSFTPAERLFSSSSVGAIGRVEQAKAIAAAGEGSVHGTAGRRGSGGGGVMTRRRRKGEDDGEGGEDAERGGGGRRRARVD